jgi:flagellar hook-length control protein FliK
VPQVASDVQAYSISRAPPTPRPAPVQDQGATPFASLLDESVQSTPDSPPPPRASDDSAARADRADQGQLAARDNDTQAKTANAKSVDAKAADSKAADSKAADSKAADSKSADSKSADSKAPDSKSAETKSAEASSAEASSAEAKSAEAKSAEAKSAEAKSAEAKSAEAKSADAKSADDTAAAQASDATSSDTSADAGNAGNAGNAGKKISYIKGKGDAKIVADVKTAEPTDNTDAAIPVTNANSADGHVAVVAPAAPPTTPIPAITPTDVAIPTAETSAIATAPAAAVAETNALIATAPKAKTGATETQQAIGGRLVDASKRPAQAAAQAPTDDKPQVAAGSPDKDTVDNVAQARGEATGKDHHVAPIEARAVAAADTNTAAPSAAADAIQPSGLTAPSQNTPATAAPVLAAASQLAPQAAAVPLAGVAIEIASKAADGKNHFDIRLDPPELGRIEVRLGVDRDGNVTTQMIADRSDTLDLLRRDASSLERALQDAGLKTADNSLQFSLRDQSSQQQQDNSGAQVARLLADDNTLPTIDAAQRGYSRLAGQGSGIDIHV